MVIAGIILVIVGTLGVVFSRYIYENFGHLPWAEAKLGQGGTLTFIRLVAVGAILFGFMLWFGIFTFVFGGIINTLFGGLRDNIQKENLNETMRSLLRASMA